VLFNGSDANSLELVVDFRRQEAAYLRKAVTIPQGMLAVEIA